MSFTADDTIGTFVDDTVIMTANGSQNEDVVQLRRSINKVA